MPAPPPPRRPVPPRRRPVPAGGPRPGARRSAPARRPPAGPRRLIRRPLADTGRRLQAIMLAALFVLSLIAGRLLQLQGLEHTAYAADASNQMRHTETLSAARGRILDRSGNVLADTVAADDVDATPSLVPDKPQVAHKLAGVLGVKPRVLLAKLAASPGYALLAHAVTPELGNEVTKLGLPGIYTEATTRRVYPDGSLASNLLGAVGTNGGLAGLELEDNKLLQGRPGSRTYEVGLDGAPIPDAFSQTDPARPGDTLHLSLQRDIQWEAQQAIAAQVRKSGARDGFVVVEDPHNGQILALADAHSYDLNKPVTSLNELSDPVVSDMYEPGSVNKVITMSAALQEGLVTPDSHFVVPPTIQQGGTTFHDAEVHGYEHLTLTGILAKSSNIGTIEVARRLGPARLDHYLLDYGYGRPTGIGLPGEAPGELLPLKDWSATTMPTVAFGQGVDVTALQVASVYSTIANGGVRVAPNLVESITGPDGRRTLPAPSRRRVISPRVARELSDMLEAVTTSEGTAPQAQIPGYRVAGKTGTANIANDHGSYAAGQYTGSFVGFAPADKPQLVVEAVVDDPHKGSVFGADVAAPVFRNVMSFALQTLHIPPTGTKPPKARVGW